MKKNYNSDSCKPDRKTIERNRRMHMKGLCFKLASLIPNHHNISKEILSQQDRLDYAAYYIRELRERVEALKRKKQLIIGTKEINTNNTTGATPSSARLPVLELRDMGSTLEVILVTGLNKNFMFYQVIGVLEEEGALVVNANFSIVGDKVFHTIHSQVTCSRVGVETSRISERLKDLVNNQSP